MIERSLAIKSPSIQYHLAGTKKVQQALALPGILEKWVVYVHMFYRVFKLDMREIKHLLGYQKCTFKS